MRRPFFKILFSFVGLLCLCFPAQAGNYSFSQAGGKIAFHNSSSLHDFDGTAKSFSGSLDTDAGTGSLSINATSLTTDLGPRDNKMHDFCLESTKFGQISFNVTAVEGAGAEGLKSGAGQGQVNLKGTLKIRDSSKAVVIPASYSFSGEKLTLTGRYSMSWADYGVPDPSILISKLDPKMSVSFTVTSQ